jgi:hypothetical protein
MMFNLPVWLWQDGVYRYRLTAWNAYGWSEPALSPACDISTSDCAEEECSADGACMSAAPAPRAPAAAALLDAASVGKGMRRLKQPCRVSCYLPDPACRSCRGCDFTHRHVFAQQDGRCSLAS